MMNLVLSFFFERVSGYVILTFYREIFGLCFCWFNEVRLLEGKGLVVVDDNEKGLDHKTLKKS